MKAGAKRRAGFEGLRKLVRGLREVASGKVLANTIIRSNNYIQGRVKGELGRHVKTGLAVNSARSVPSMRSIDLTLQGYYRYIRWSFKKGFPSSAVARVRKILAEELAKALGTGGK